MSSQTQARREKIVELLHEAGNASIDELSEYFKVSGMTIRRDLAVLDQAGRLRRLHGGVVSERSAAGRSLKDVKSSLRPDVLILNPMDQRTARLIVQNYSQLSIPIIAESIPFPGVAALIAIDSFHAGHMLGEWVGDYAREHLGGAARVLFVGMPSFSDTAERARGFFEGLAEKLPSAVESIVINGQGLRKESCQVALAVLSTHPEINIMIGVNDQAALGILDAVRELKLPLARILIGTFGLEGSAGKEMLVRGDVHCVGVAMFPEWIGRACVDAAVLTYNHRPLASQLVTPVRVVTADSLSHYYRAARQGWEIQWEVVERLQAEEGDPVELPPDGLTYPARIDFVRYLHDEYYENLVQGMRQHARELGIEVHITDASDDLAASIELARRAIARAAAELVNPGDSVIIDAGMSNLYLAQELADISSRPVTVITHSLPVLELLKNSSHITLMAIGGTLNRESQCFLGTQAEAGFDGLHADKSFLGVTGVSIPYGITNANFTENEIKRRIIKAAKEVIVLADSYKIGEVALARIAPISAFQKLVCDDQMTSEDRVAFTQAGIEIVLADNRT
jgi:DeoR/GlpR family transcriptional regulator of sugar metabolism